MDQDTENRERKARAAANSRRWARNNQEKVRAMRQRYRENNRQAVRDYNRMWLAENRENARAVSLEWRINNVNRIMWKDAEKRAKKSGLPFNLGLADIVIPSVCPVLGIPLKYGVGKRTGASPSLDRLRPELGYVKGNVAVISWRANDLKRDATPDELRRVADWYDKTTGVYIRYSRIANIDAGRRLVG